MDSNYTRPDVRFWLKEQSKEKAHTPGTVVRMATRELILGTLNCRGLKGVTAREETMRWMEQGKVDLLFLQETHIAENSVELKRDYTWYISGNNASNKEFRGVGVVVRKRIKKSVTKIIIRIRSCTWSYKRKHRYMYLQYMHHMQVEAQRKRSLSTTK